MLLLAVLGGCTSDTAVHLHSGTLQVRFLDIGSSCTWNLVTLDNQQLYDFFQTRKDSFLHSNINQLEEAQSLSFGDTLTISYELLEEVPPGYEAPLVLCNRPPGIVIKILEVIE